MAARKYFHNEFTDAQIRAAYSHPDFNTQRGRPVNALAERLGWPKHTIYRRALAIGAVRARVKEPPWSQAEMDLLAQHAHKVDHVIAKIFRRHGYARTPGAIALRRHRFLNCGISDLRADAGLYTGHATAKLMGVDPRTISRWIRLGWLKARPLGTDRTGIQGGDIWGVHERDIRQFIIDFTAHVRLDCMDKFWVVELLAGSRGVKGQHPADAGKSSQAQAAPTHTAEISE